MPIFVLFAATAASLSLVLATVSVGAVIVGGGIGLLTFLIS